MFNDVTDRDAGFYQHVEGNPHTWWGPADFARDNRYIAGFTRRTHSAVVLWQLPLGDTHENDTLGPLPRQPPAVVARPGSAAHLRATRDAGVIGLLFGGRRGRQHRRTDRRRLVLPTRATLRSAPAVAR